MPPINVAVKIDSAGGNAANRKHVLIASKAGIADVDIVADDVWIGTGVSAYGGDKIASAILKRAVADGSVVASVSVGLQRERAHCRIVVAIVIIDQGDCSKGAISCARSVEQESRGPHCRVRI